MVDTHGYILADSNDVINYTAKNYAGMYLYENASATPIDTVAIYHLTRFFSAGLLNNWIFDAGSTGAITAFADAGGGQVTVTSNGHGLQNGEIITIASTTNYNGVFVVANSAANTFTITDTWVANDATGNFYQGSSLKAGTGAAGLYQCTFTASTQSAGNNKLYHFELFQNATEVNKISSEMKIATGADTQNCGATGFIQIAEGDYITIAVEGETDATDLTLIHANLNLHMVGK